MPASKEMISHMYLKIGGAQADEPLMRKVKEIVVDTGMYLPAMFSVQFYDTDLALMNGTNLDIGKEVEISGKSGALNSSKSTLAKGEIVSIEPEFDQDFGTTLTIRGYDKSHRLHRGKKNRVFKQVKDSDMIQQIVQTCGLSADIDSTSVTYDHVFQENQTDMEFVQDRAQRNGYMAYFEDGKLHFKKAGSSTGSGATLEWRTNLARFQARLSGAGQVKESEVRGWDVKKKEAIVGKKSATTGIDKVSAKDGGSIASSAFSSSSGLFQSRVVKDASEAEALAQANLNAQTQKFFRADGTCMGDPRVLAGKKVTLKGIGTRFSGDYTVSRAIHRYNNNEYYTDFEISGYRTNTLPQLLSEQNGREAYGVVVGIVTNNSDPDDLSRVCVKYPDIDDKLEGTWARLSSPMAGPERGIEFIPEVNDEVLVAFEHNDFNRPYIIGSLWNGKDKPPEKNSSIIASGKVNKRIIKSRSGHIITLDDTDKSEKITIQDKAGQTVVIDSSNGSEKIQITDKGKSTITMDGSKKSVSIESAQDMTIKAKGKIQIEAQQDINVNGMNLKMESKANMDMKATGPLKMQGATASVQGQGTAEFKASGPVTIQGAIVKIN